MEIECIEIRRVKVNLPLTADSTVSIENAKKSRKTTEWERLEISSRKLEIPREHFMQRWAL